MQTEEELQVLRAVLDMVEKGEAGVLATVVWTEGSTPRRPGARMLVDREGRSVGTVGGGGLEARVLEEAQEVFSTGKPKKTRYDMRSGETGICGGAVEVFFEPVGAPKRLVIVGAGHVGQALARAGRLAGFRFVLVDDRPVSRAPDHPTELPVHRGEKLEEALASVGIVPSDAVVVATRGHEKDEEALAVVLRSPASYLGMIGSKRKVATIRASLLSRGFTEADWARVHAPVGLAIGAETPAEIAVSILAELIAHFRGG